MGLVIYSVAVSVILFLICHFFGQVVKNRFSLPILIPSALIGVSVLFSLVQIVTYIENLASIKTSICALISMVLVLAMIVVVLINRKHVKVTKINLSILLLSIYFTFICLLRSCNYSLGSTSDSVFYMSMVSENAFSEKWISMEYYTGRVVEYFLPLYDFQGFYHFFAHITKIGAKFIDAFSYSPIYIWSALSLFLLCLFESIFTIFMYVHDKNRTIGYIYLLFAFTWSCTSWNYLYGYLGNSWRVIFLTLMMMCAYFYCKDKRVIYLTLILLSTCAMIACSSSGLFISLFATGALVVYSFLYDNNIKNNIAAYFTTLSAFVYLFFLVYANVGNMVVFFILAYFIGLCVYLILRKLKFKYRVLVVILGIICLICISLIIPSSFSFVSFFDRNINEMTVNYFVFDSLGTISANLVWILSVVYLLFNNTKILMNNQYFKYLLLVMMLFLNPVVGRFLMEYVTDTVLYRSYEIFFNSFNLVFLAYGVFNLVHNFKYKILRYCMLLISSILLVFGIYENLNDSPYSFDLVKEINPIYRIPEDELDLDLQLAQLANSSYGRLRVISQFPFTKGIVRNIYLAFGIDTVRSFCTTCNTLEGPVEEPTPIFNLFLLRDYADQMIYSVPADYEGACDPLFEHRFEYLLLDKSQTRLDNGVYVPIYYNMRACFDVIYENESGVVMDSRYVG